MNKRGFFLRFILLSSLASATLAPAQAPAPETGTLQGVVTDANGAVRRGASVVIHYWRELDESRRHWGPAYEPVVYPMVYTDSEGRFSVQLPPGTYDVFIAHLTLSPFAKKVKIEPGKETRLKIKLRSAGLTITLAPSPIPSVETGTLDVVTYDEYGAVVPRASILIQHWTRPDEHEPHWAAGVRATGRADSAGRFSVELPPEVYDVFVSDSLLSPFAKKIRIKASKVTTLDSKLRCDPAFCAVVY